MSDGAAQGHHRHRPHAVGHARPPLGRERPPAHATRAWRSSTTASSRTTWLSRRSCAPRATSSPRRRTPRCSPTSSRDELERGVDLRGGRARGHQAGEGHLRPGGRHRERSRTASSCTKDSSPMVLGLGQGQNFVASDVPALLEHTRDFVYMEEGDLAVVTAAARGHLQPPGPEGEPAHPPHRLDADDGGEGRPQALHAQGDLRAASRRRGHPARPHAPVRGRRPLRGLEPLRREGRARITQGDHPGVRHLVALGHRRQGDDRVAGAHPGRGGAGQRVPLPRPHRGAARTWRSPSASPARRRTRWRPSRRPRRAAPPPWPSAT